jgi:hypothetical protein
MSEIAHRHLTQRRAIATHYQGAHFRSRLEARWAAFFDLCGWRWEYEPPEEDGWIPDFALIGAKGIVRAEVKPIHWFGHDEIVIIDQCLAYPGLTDKLSPHLDKHGEILVLGAYPHPFTASYQSKKKSRMALGVRLGSDYHCLMIFGFGIITEEDEDCIVDFAALLGDPTLRMRAKTEHEEGNFWGLEPSTIDPLWRRAGAQVQWMKNKRETAE